MSGPPFVRLHRWTVFTLFLCIGPADLKVVLDVCEVDLLGPRDAVGNSAADNTFPQHAIRFWLEQGVAGFVICDTDAAYSGKVK